MSMLNCRDALKIYNSAKIEYNPADYNLKDRLIIDSKTMYKNCEYIPCIPSYSLEKRLLELTGSNEQNPTFSLDCRTVFSHGQKDIKVTGPFPSLEEEAAAVHKGYWD